MKSYNYPKNLNGFKGSEVGLCVWVLVHRLCGKVKVGNKLQSESWWLRKYGSFVDNKSEIDISMYDWECCTAQPTPIRYEDEFKLINNYDNKTR